MTTETQVVKRMVEKFRHHQDTWDFRHLQYFVQQELLKDDLPGRYWFGPRIPRTDIVKKLARKVTKKLGQPFRRKSRGPLRKKAAGKTNVTRRG